MILAKVVSKIWATRKAEKLNGLTFLLVEEITGEKNQKGSRMIVVDSIGAGIGDKVMVSIGSTAREVFGDNRLPTDAVVVGIIDADCPIDEE